MCNFQEWCAGQPVEKYNQWMKGVFPDNLLSLQHISLLSLQNVIKHADIDTCTQLQPNKPAVLVVQGV